MKYKILYDYNSEGFQFDDSEHDTVEGAVRHAVAQNYSTSFLIVQICWQPFFNKGSLPPKSENKT